MKVENDAGYSEGYWQGKKLPQNIANTVYKTLETVIAIKTELINHFETQFRYSREMNVKKFDYNYSFNVGLLDALLEYQQTPIHGTKTA